MGRANNTHTRRTASQVPHERTRPSTHYRTTYVPHQNQTPIWFIVCAIIFVVVVGVSLGVFLAMGGPSIFKPDPTTTSSAPEVEVAAPQEQGDAAPDAAPATEVAPAPDMGDPRVVEFAVDPARTDWNFEAGDERVVYLTFDDGPSENTAAVLDILDTYGVKATFFVTGINPAYFDMIAECHRRGHTIGLHTYSHLYEQVYASTDAYWADLNQIAEVVRQQIGYVPAFIRFPGGSSNTISADYTPGIMSELAGAVTAAGYQYYDWDASCGDGAEHTADELVEATRADTSYGYTNICFLIHDGTGKVTSVEALPRIIEYFRDEGYSFAPLDRTSRVCHHGISN